MREALFGRSTKAGARTPATHRRPAVRRSRAPGAQRRPGREPRRHTSPASAPRPRPRTLNEGRGANPGDTGRYATEPCVRRSAQRRPGREPRRHPRCSRCPGWLFPPLNEGRGANPGDTWRKRLGVEPRPAPLNEGRGANPGDTPRAMPSSSPMTTAQRRPGREPRRHLAERAAVGRHTTRSTKAGARTPATRHRDGRPAAGGGRSTKAGARTPATRGGTGPCSRRRIRAQRRPGREPRRHVLASRSWTQTIQTAQRRPGREPRRHMEKDIILEIILYRSTKAGARTPATRAPGPHSIRRAGVRSTKAGARTPATPSLVGDALPIQTALNEGRGANPGDTFDEWIRTVGQSANAQRRPGREPRRHVNCPGSPRE